MGKLLPHPALFTFLFFLSVLIFIADNLKLLTPIKVSAGSLTNPVLFSLYSIKQQSNRQFAFVWQARESAQQNRALQENISKLLSENAELKRQLAESEALIAQNQHLDPKTYKLLPARPIGLDRYLRVDKGSDDGIKIGQSVVVNDNLIGQVVEVSAKSAAVRRLIDPDQKVAAFSFGKDGKAKGILIGEFGIGMLMDKILHEEPLEKGDLIYSEGTEGLWPRGLILGKVTEILEMPNQIFKQAKVGAVFDIKDLDLVFVIEE